MNLDAFSKSAEKTEKATGKLDDVMKGLSPSALTAVAGVTALVGALKGLTGMGKGIVDMASHFETVRTELGTVLQDVEKGSQLFEDLRKFSFETTFGVDELASASTQLLNAGKSAKTLQKDLKMLGDLAGGNKNKFAELTSIFSKVATQGKATSVQLQQINLRGIPITKTLKEMGITGVASAEDLTRAFQKLTEEGGQFHNAMGNIIDTIEGKRGFITDTLKEIAVNFGEVSGITEMYKNILDIVYEALNKVNNKLIEWNENPVMKAIIKGVVTASVGALAGVIVGSIIPALTTVVGLLASINPAILIGAGIGALTGVITGMALKTKELTSDFKELQDAIKETEELSNKYSKKTRKSAVKAYYDGNASEEQMLIVYNEMQNSALNKLFENQMNYKNMGEAQRNLWTEEDKKAYDAENERLQKLISFYDSQIKIINSSLSLEEERNAFLEEQNELIKKNTEKYNEIVANAGNIYYSKNERGRLEKEKIDIENQIKEIQTLINSGTYRIFDESGNTIDRTLDKDTLALYNKDLETLTAMLKENSEKLSKLGVTIDKTNEDLPYTFEKWISDLQTSTKLGEQAGGYAMGSLASSSGDLSNALDGFKNGGIWGAIIEVLVGAITNVAKNLDNFDKVMNPITHWMEKLKPLLEIIFDLTEDIIDSIDNVLSVITLIITILKPLFRILRTIGKAIAVPLNMLGKLFSLLAGAIETLLEPFNAFMDMLDRLFGIFDEEEEQKTSEVELLKRLNEEYDNLLTSMKEQEEYYIQEKKRINSQTYIDEILGHRRVNDMILTPEGRFSTHPDDTIMAMKHPEDLMRGGVTMIQPIINNSISDSVEASVETRDNNGITELVVNISRKIADDYARGKNGWDSAVTYRNQKTAGRSVIS